MGSIFILLLLFLPAFWAKPTSTINDGQPGESQMDEALQKACTSGNVDFIINRILTFGRAAVTQARADFDRAGPFRASNVTCLMIAAYKNHEKLVKLLIKAGSDLNARDEQGLTAAFYTVIYKVIDCEKADETILSLLIESGADIMAKSWWGSTLLHIAASYECYRHAKLLIEKGADVNAKDNSGKTPLILAVDFNPTRHRCEGTENTVMALLIESGAVVSASDNDGLTPLHPAAMLGCYRRAKLLIEKGADVNAKFDWVTTPLMAALGGPWKWSKTSENYLRTISLLIKNGAELNAISTNGKNALCYAASLGFHDAIEVMLESGAAIDSVSDNGDTPLLCAVKHYEDPDVSNEASNYERSVKLLLAAGAKVDAQDKDGATALTYAISHQKIRLIQILLEAAFVQAVKEAEAAYLKAVKEVKKAYVKKSITVKGGKFDTEKFNKAMQNPDVLKALGLEKNSSNVKTTNANSIE